MTAHNHVARLLSRAAFGVLLAATLGAGAAAAAPIDPELAGPAVELPKIPGQHCVSVPTGVYIDGVQQYRWVCQGGPLGAIGTAGQVRR